MDPTTLLGIILGFALIVNGISFAKIGNFIDIPSMVIVIGGALSATLSSYPLGILKDIPKHFAVLIRGNRYNIPKIDRTACRSGNHSKAERPSGVGG